MPPVDTQKKSSTGSPRVFCATQVRAWCGGVPPRSPGLRTNPARPSSLILPPGPAHRSSHRPYRRRLAPGSMLGRLTGCPLVLDQRLAVAHRRQSPRVTARQIHRKRRIPTDGSAHRANQFAGGQHPGRAARCTTLAVRRRWPKLPRAPQTAAPNASAKAWRSIGDAHVHRRGMPDRIVLRIRSGFASRTARLGRRSFVVTPLSETCSRRIEFDSGF